MGKRDVDMGGRERRVEEGGKQRGSDEKLLELVGRRVGRAFERGRERGKTEDGGTKGGRDEGIWQTGRGRTGR